MGMDPGQAIRQFHLYLKGLENGAWRTARIWTECRGRWESGKVGQIQGDVNPIPSVDVLKLNR